MFRMYECKKPGHLDIQAAVLTEENLVTLAEVVKGEVVNHRLLFKNESGEVGDYLISDQAGNYRIADKEIFEANYIADSSERV